MSQDDIRTCLKNGEMEISELAKALNVTPNAVTQSINRMIAWDKHTNQTTILKRKINKRNRYRLP